MKQRFFQLSILAAFMTGMSACTDVIDLDVPNGTSYPVVDAWITTEPGTQYIRVTKSVSYTQSGSAPVVSDATITLYDETTGDIYPFVFADSVYKCDPGSKQIGQVNHTYRLRVEYDSNTYEATDTIKPVAAISKIDYKYKEEGDDGVSNAGYYVRFYATDMAGQTDYTWVRSYRNNLNNNNIVEDFYVIDGGFSEGLSDGQEFPLFVGESVNDDEHPFLKGDLAIVKLRSLSYPSYFWVTSVQSQLESGGLFATVLANVGTNLRNVTDGGGKGKLLGWFGTSAVSADSITTN
ncbi:DUF4249 domain-containing protein [Chitinophaga sp.]|uniref:DUF4249 domain-containing protein n=1 Tax=Chitinophaga sp. TaxID=1869181 RepID=UPI0031E040A5